MEFVTRQAAPKKLIDNKADWTRPWVEYYNKLKNHEGNLLRKTKPNTSNWLHDDIRKPLMYDFKDNCGYCGVLIAIPYKAGDEFIAGKGDVDHLRAKSEHPHLSYSWLNYIWSCKSCNQKKGAFDSENFPIFNPCSVDDCNKICFIAESGSYELNAIESKDKKLINQLKNTSEKTLLNSGSVCEMRRDQITLLTSYFESIHNLLYINNDIPAFLIKILKESNQKEIGINIDRIKIVLQSQNYKLLILAQYNKLCKQFNNVEELLI